MARALAIGSQSGAQEAAQDALGAGTNALQAVLTGFFSSAGADPGVLFSPISLLIGGLGSGVFAYDGRCRQPGRDNKRPRGFLSTARVPESARVAAPGSIAAIAIACAFHPGTSLLASARPGIALAKAAGAKGRAELLEFVARMGATSLTETSVRKAFIAQFGSVEDGLLSAADLTAPERLNVRARESTDGWCTPWGADGPEEAPLLGAPHALVAGDVQGLFVALSYSSLPEGPLLEPFEVTVPRVAAPVMRGVTRVSPGAALPLAESLRILREDDGSICGARAVVGGRKLELRREASGTQIQQIV